MKPLKNLFGIGNILLIILVVNSCTKDLGNYTYTTINEVNISGIDSELVIDYKDPILISPTLSFTKPGYDTTHLVYEWLIKGIPGATSTSFPFVISRSRDLISQDGLLPLLPPGWVSLFNTYIIRYRITDTLTGIIADHNFTLTISNPAQEGWLLLCDPQNGTTRLDMVARALKDSMVVDVLQAVRSTFPVNEPPTFLGSFIGHLGEPTSGLFAFAIGTKTNAAILGLDTLQYKPSYDLSYDIGPNVPQITDFTGTKIYNKYFGDALFLYNNNNVYQCRSPYFQAIFSNLINYQKGSTLPFRASPWIAVDNKQTSPISDDILFNEETKSFVRHASNSANCENMPGGDSLFNFNIKQNLLYMKFVKYNGGDVFAIVENEGIKSLARFKISGVKEYYDQIQGIDIKLAEHFAVSPVQGYVFYTAGSKVYEYDFNLKKSFLMKDYGNRKITVIKFHDFSLAGVTGMKNSNFYLELEKKLAICTYDESDPVSSGILDVFDVPDVNGSLVPYRSYSGSGKIVDLNYKEN